MADAATVSSHSSPVAPVEGRAALGRMPGAPVGTRGRSRGGCLSVPHPWKFIFLCVFPNKELEPLRVDGAAKEAESAQPLPSPCEQGDTCSPCRTPQPALGACFLARWQSPLSLRDGRVEEAQTSGAGWIPCVVCEREHEAGGQAARVLQAEWC